LKLSAGVLRARSF